MLLGFKVFVWRLFHTRHFCDTPLVFTYIPSLSVFLKSALPLSRNFIWNTNLRITKVSRAKKALRGYARLNGWKMCTFCRFFYKSTAWWKFSVFVLCLHSIMKYLKKKKFQLKNYSFSEVMDTYPKLSRF